MDRELVDRWTTIEGAVVHSIDSAPGGTGPSLLVIPGFLSSTDSFARLALLLSSILRVVVVDLPGFGRSEPPAADWSFPSCTRFLRRFMDEAGLASPFLLGSSMSAAITVRVAASIPFRVGGLVLLNPLGPGKPRLASALAAGDPALPLICALMPRFLVNRMINAQVLDPRVVTDEVRAAYWRPFGSAAGRRAVVQVARTFIARADFASFDDLVHKVTQPILIIEGSANPMRSPRIRQELLRAIPGCTVEVIEGSGHILALEAPERLAEAISPWLSVHVPPSERESRP